MYMCVRRVIGLPSFLPTPLCYPIICYVWGTQNLVFPTNGAIYIVHRMQVFFLLQLIYFPSAPDEESVKYLFFAFGSWL